MLQQLYIKNYAIIDELKISFSDTLNIITGETGAGKSIIINALSLILGNRASKSVVRDGQNKCIIEAFFLLEKQHKHFFESNDLDFENESSVRREITNKGKSRIFINDTPVTLALVKELTSILIDFNSQHQKFALLDANYQLSTIDKFAQNDTVLLQYQNVFTDYQSSKKELKSVESKLNILSKEMDYIQFQLNELEEANLSSETEFEDLEIEQKKLSNFEILSEKFQDSTQAGEQIVQALKEYEHLLSEIIRIDESLEPALKRLESCNLEFKDIKLEIESANATSNFDPNRFQEVEDRLSILHKLMNKHQLKTTQQLIEYQNNLSNETGSKIDLEKEIVDLQAKIVEQEKQLKDLALALQKARHKTSKVLAKEIVENLKDVGIDNAKVEFLFNDLESFSTSGLDAVELVFSANPGFEAKPLRENASGGEISRFMLAIKNVLSKKMKTETIILDEIDAGISGAAATMVADKLEALSDKQQIICITHLPQVASKGQHHFYVQKGVEQDKTFTKIKLLKQNERVEVLAELLGLKSAGEKALENARELLKIKS